MVTGCEKHEKHQETADARRAKPSKSYLKKGNSRDLRLPDPSNVGASNGSRAVNEARKFGDSQSRTRLPRSLEATASYGPFETTLRSRRMPITPLQSPTNTVTEVDSEGELKEGLQDQVAKEVKRLEEAQREQRNLRDEEVQEGRDNKFDSPTFLPDKIGFLETKLSAERETSKQLQRQLDERATCITNLEAELKSIEDNEIYDITDGLLQERTTLTARLVALKECYDRVRAERDDFRKQLTISETNVFRLETELERAKVQLADSEAEVQNLRTRVNRMREELEDANERRDRMGDLASGIPIPSEAGSEQNTTMEAARENESGDSGSGKDGPAQSSVGTTSRATNGRKRRISDGSKRKALGGVSVETIRETKSNGIKVTRHTLVRVTEAKV